MSIRHFLFNLDEKFFWLVTFLDSLDCYFNLEIQSLAKSLLKKNYSTNF